MVEVKTPQIKQEIKLITILGPTASGKTGRAVLLCRRFNGEVISADSRQVYSRMDIGTGKDLFEYGNIPYHLIDICEAGEKYNLHKFITDFHIALKKISDLGKLPVLCGGSGLYLETALSGVKLPEVPENKLLRETLNNYSLDQLAQILSRYKKLHNTTDIDSVKRAIRAIEIEEFYRNNPEMATMADKKSTDPIPSLIIGIDIPRDERRKRISSRLKTRLEQGMVTEVEALLASGIKPEDLIYYGLEYKYLTLYLMGQLSYPEMVSELEIAIHQFAKRQMTWFRGMERRGFNIHWLPYDMNDEEFISAVCKAYKENKL